MPTAILETQPHSTEAEQTVIGALLLDPEAIFKIDAKLAPSDFYVRFGKNLVISRRFQRRAPTQG